MLCGAGDRTRTGDSLVGNEGLYQLSYSRSKRKWRHTNLRTQTNHREPRQYNNNETKREPKRYNDDEEYRIDEK